jgi:hypothetical protein
VTAKWVVLAYQILRWFWFGPIDAEPADDMSLGNLRHRTRCAAVVHLAARDHAATNDAVDRTPAGIAGV